MRFFIWKTCSCTFSALNNVCRYSFQRHQPALRRKHSQHWTFYQHRSSLLMSLTVRDRQSCWCTHAGLVWTRWPAVGSELGWRWSWFSDRSVWPLRQTVAVTCDTEQSCWPLTCKAPDRGLQLMSNTQEIVTGQSGSCSGSEDQQLRPQLQLETWWWTDESINLYI